MGTHELNIRIGLYDEDLSKLAFHLNGPLDYVRMVLESTNFLLLYQDRKKNSKGRFPGQFVIKSIVGSRLRVFIYHQTHKYVSFNYPFKVSRPDRVIIDCNGCEIDSTMVAKLSRILNEFYDDRGRVRKNNRGIPKSLASIAENLIDSSEEDDMYISDLEIDIFSLLLSNEPGYVRYDYDPEAENGKIHPLHHLDINYSVGSTYKYGLYYGLDTLEFEGVFAKDREKLYLHPYHSMLQPKEIVSNTRRRKFTGRKRL